MASTLRAGLYALYCPLLANRGVPRQNAIGVNAFEISNQEEEAGAANQAIRSATMLHPNGKSTGWSFQCTIEGPAVIREKPVDDRTRYDTVKSRLRAMGEGTAQQVHDALDPTPYSVREVENTLDEMILAERDEFERVGRVYRWKKSYRFRMEKK